MKNFLTCLLVVFLAGSQPVQGEEIKRLTEALVDEITILDVEIDDYAVTRERERDALGELQRLTAELDQGLRDPNTSLVELRRLELGVERVRERAFDLSKASAATRLEMYQRMRQVDETLTKLESEGVVLLAPGQGVTGTWKIEVPEYEVKGVMSLSQEGTAVRGQYRMSTGARGLLEGTFSEGELEFSLDTPEHDRQAISKGALNSDDGEIRGFWLQRELASGEPARVEWSARRLSLELLFSTE
ncbi:MAG: hypothetical protein K0U98_00025 [Deltaproteobacteria bacterium]|nr:hypothetical protein [Deltaproteobacteria bacterium]